MYNWCVFKYTQLNTQFNGLKFKRKKNNTEIIENCTCAKWNFFCKEIKKIYRI